MHKKIEAMGLFNFDNLPVNTLVGADRDTFARAVCGKEIRQQTIDQIIDQVLSLPEGTRIQVMAPVIRGKKGEHTKIFEDAKRSGYVRARVDGNLYELDEEIKLEKNKKHTIEIVVDRLIIRPDIQQRLTDRRSSWTGSSSGRTSSSGSPTAWRPPPISPAGWWWSTCSGRSRT